MSGKALSRMPSASSRNRNASKQLGLIGINDFFGLLSVR
jgi:hypothetical protein